MNTILADLHTHTVASHHAFSTLYENIMEAQHHNLDYLAITDHLFYPEDRISRLNELSYIANTSRFKEIKNMRVIGGIETNLNHTISCEDDVHKIVVSVPWRLVGFHSWFLDPSKTAPGELPAQFESSLKCKNRIMPTAFAHIERGLKPLCDAYGCDQVNRALRDIVDVAVEHDIYLEINNSSITRGAMIRDFMRNWITYAKESKILSGHGCSLLWSCGRL